MNVKELVRGLSVIELKGMPDKGADITNITSDSRTVGPGSLFIAIKGPLSDGHRYISDVIKKQPSAIVFDDINFTPKVSCSTPLILVKNSKNFLLDIANRFYGYPYDNIKSVGITGTNGKTTTSYLVRSVLSEAGLKCALIGTIGYKITETNIPSHNTTPGIIELHELLRDMISAGNKYVAMEVSSHALDQDRVAGIVFSAAIFTNLTQDHLDYHKDMEDYFAAKKKLFYDHVGKHSSLIMNIDDSFGSRLFKVLKGKKFGFGFKEGDIHVHDHEIARDFTSANIVTPKGVLGIKSRLVGRHNLYNILACAAFGVANGIDLDIIKRGIEQVSVVPGRLDRIDSDKGFSVFVDYAHTDDALKNVLESLRLLVHNGRIITVFGCGGDRDKGKRPKMGRIACALSDYAIVTSDNPRSEDPREIAGQIVSGIALDNFEIELDRSKAISKAIKMAKEGDFVLVAGKGHETYQIIKDKIIPFDDKTVVLDALGIKEK